MHKQTISIILGSLWKELDTLLMLQNLKKWTLLKAKLDTEIRWSSTFEMVKRFIDIKEEISALKIPDIYAIMPNATSVEIWEFYNRLKQHE